MNEQLLEETIKELATKIANLEIENAQLKAVINQNNKQQNIEKENVEIVKTNEGDD